MVLGNGQQESAVSSSLYVFNMAEDDLKCHAPPLIVASKYSNNE